MQIVQCDMMTLFAFKSKILIWHCLPFLLPLLLLTRHQAFACFVIFFSSSLCAFSNLAHASNRINYHQAQKLLTTCFSLQIFVIRLSFGF